MTSTADLSDLLGRVEAQIGAVWAKWTCPCGWVANTGANCGWCRRGRPAPSTVDLDRSDAVAFAALLKALIASNVDTLGGGNRAAGEGSSRGFVAPTDGQHSAGKED